MQLRIDYLYLILILPALAVSQTRNFADLIADSVYVSVEADSLDTGGADLPYIADRRAFDSNILAIRQTKKYRYIPVDRYMALNSPLSTLMGRQLVADSVTVPGRLVIDNVTLWKNGKNWMLNGYSYLVDSDGSKTAGWQWEFVTPSKRKEEPETAFGRLVDTWLVAHADTLKSDLLPPSPRRYRRQLMTWADMIIIPGGYIIDARLSLDFPTDQRQKYGRSVSSLYYRKSHRHESVAIGGIGQQRYIRLNDKLLARGDVVFRIGFNNFDTDYYDYLDWWNIFLINVSSTAAIEYRPIYHKGLFFAAGVHLSANALPEVIAPFTGGLMLSMGVVLP